jgi:hypothetical protein
LVHRFGLRTVVDIRRPSETRHKSVPLAEHGVRWLNCPFGLGKGAAVAVGGADFASVYLGYLEADPGPVVQASKRCSSPTTIPRCSTAPPERTAPAC